MDLQPMTMEKEAAQAAFREYRGAFMAERNRIDGELMRGYKALAEGKQLIRLTETITAGGVDEGGKPRLAIARADERAITFERGSRGSVTFTPGWIGSRPIRATDRRFVFPDGTLPAGEWVRSGDWEALTPIVPPRFRPPHAAMTNFHILWEATWVRTSQRRRAPHDPALLKHLGGDLWAVLAIWDLSPLEQAVLEMRTTQ